MNILVVIPARGGSKGLPRKNIKILAGKPLIAWSIEAGLNSRFISDVIVSTEDKEIAEIAIQYGAQVPFLRPPELAKDATPTMEAIEHLLDNLKKSYDLILILEPTSPLRDTKDIDNAIETLLATKEARSIVGVSLVESAHPNFLVAKNESSFLTPYLNENKITRRQDLDPLYFFEGSIYLSYIDTLRERRTFYHEKTLGYEVPKWKAYEIDDLSDFYIVECLMKKKLAGEL